jgi:triosephosphate isomerase (TIM)
MRQRLVAGNWKMHGSLPDNESLLKAVAGAAGSLRSAACAVCVPFPYLHQAQRALTGSKAQWGAQNVSPHAKGAYTGEVSVSMLKDFDCRYAIVGHSERRALYGEDDATVAAKAKAVLAGGMVPIVCVGESLEERESGATEQVVGRQLDAVVGAIGAAGIAQSVVAYEPVWAIGTGKTATPEQAHAVHAFIRTRVAASDPGVAQALTILYGGSVKAANATSLFAMADVDGGLIGGASLNAEEFAAICAAADRT